MFAVRNRIVNISYNCPNKGIKTSCISGENEDMIHIYNCGILNTNKQSELPYEKIFNGNVKQQTQVYQNLEKREKIISESKPPCDPHGSAVCQ